MHIGVSTAAFFLRLNNEDVFPVLRELGFDYTEMFFTSYCEYHPSFARSFLQKQGNITVNSVHVLNTQFEPQLFNLNPRVKRDAYQFLGQAMESAHLLGATRYTFHGLSRLKRASRLGENDNYEFVGKRTQEVFEFCQNYGVTLCQENVEWSFYNRPGIFARLKEYCPGLLGVLDIKQARISGYPWQEYLNEMGESLSHVHVTDVDENGRMCLPGKGIFPFPELIARLKDVGFQGCILLEPYQNDYRELSELKESGEYLKELISK